MNFLELTYHSNQSNFGAIIDSLWFHTYTSRTNYDNPNFQSYDVYIINFSYLIALDENDLVTIIDQLIISKKPCIIIYSDQQYFIKSKLSTQNVNYYDKCMNVIKCLNKYINFEISSIDAGVIDYADFHVLTSFYSTDNSKLLLQTCENKKFICVKNTKYYHMVNKNNILIMLDPEIYNNCDKINNGFIDFILELVIEKNNSENHPQWVDNIFILDDINIDNQIEKHKNDIEKIRSEIANLKIKADKNNDIKKLFYSEGDELVQVVILILNEILGIDNKDFSDIKKEDYRIHLSGYELLFEVKGVNRPVKKKDVSQIWTHLVEAEELDETKEYKGCLIVNPYRLVDLEERIKKDFYHPDVKKLIEFHNVCSIDTITLYCYYKNFIDGCLTADDFKTILLEKTYNEPILDIIQFKGKI